jgi:hypothetical protein
VPKESGSATRLPLFKTTPRSFALVLLC